MQVQVIGKKAMDFMGKEGPVRMTHFYVAFASEGVEGHETGVVKWDEIWTGRRAPNYSIGEIVEAQYNNRGYLKFPAEVTSGAMPLPLAASDNADDAGEKKRAG
jgi:hypothetical protein